MSQKEDYNWVFGFASQTEYCSPNNEWGESAIPTVFTFNTDPPSFYQSKEITMNMDYTNATGAFHNVFF